MTQQQPDRVGSGRNAEMPQFTWRAVVTGFLLGGALCITNLYVGAKVGVTMGMGITAAILAASFFKLVTRELHLLETNIVLVMAGAAGYIVSPLTASVAAYVLVSGSVVMGWQVVPWLCGIALIGASLAVPWKRVFANDAQFPFPEGTAAARTIEALHSGEPGHQAELQPTGRPARTLTISAALAFALRLFQSPVLVGKLGLGSWRVPEMLDDFYLQLASKYGWWSPTLAGVTWRELTIRPSLDLAVLGIGGLMGIRTGVSLLVGAVINYGFLAPWMVARGDIVSRISAEGELLVGFRAITTWSLWAGVALMTSASLWSLLVQRGAFLTSTSNLGRSDEAVDEREVPVSWAAVGLLLGAGLAAWGGAVGLGLSVPTTFIAIGMGVLTSVIAIHATALTSITPTGALGRLSQLVFGVTAPRQLDTNVLAGGLSAEVALQAATLTQNWKTAHLLGASPRWVMLGHLLGAFAGALVSVSLFSVLFLAAGPDALVSDEFPFPAAVVWQAVAETSLLGACGSAGKRHGCRRRGGRVGRAAAGDRPPRAPVPLISPDDGVGVCDPVSRFVGDLRWGFFVLARPARRGFTRTDSRLPDSTSRTDLLGSDCGCRAGRCHHDGLRGHPRARLRPWSGRRTCGENVSERDITTRSARTPTSRSDGYCRRRRLRLAALEAGLRAVRVDPLTSWIAIASVGSRDSRCLLRDHPETQTHHQSGRRGRRGSE